MLKKGISISPNLVKAYKIDSAVFDIMEIYAEKKISKSQMELKTKVILKDSDKFAFSLKESEKKLWAEHKKKCAADFLLPLFSFAQDISKKANTITVKGVTFNQSVNALLDKGYTIQKIDSNYKTVITEFNEWSPKQEERGMQRVQVYICTKDSTIIITAKWYSYVGLSRGLFEPSREPGPTDIYTVEYSWGVPKKLFLFLDEFAKSFKGEVSYAKL